MRRRIVQGLLILVALGIAAGGYFRLLTGGPVFLIGGGWLRGELVEEPVDDWNFISKQQHNLDVESRARWLPYSVSVWFMVHEGQLYLLLPNLFGDGLKLRIDEDANLRVRIEGKIYPRRAVQVTDAANMATLLTPFLRRQMAVEIEGAVRRVTSGLGADVWVYRLEDRESLELSNAIAPARSSSVQPLADGKIHSD
ncbi:MAG: hypothetical protein GY723_03440 [bacterium]|nr:hypothetical protein [bacterium]